MTFSEGKKKKVIVRLSQAGVGIFTWTRGLDGVKQIRIITVRGGPQAWESSYALTRPLPFKAKGRKKHWSRFLEHV